MPSDSSSMAPRRRSSLGGIDTTRRSSLLNSPHDGEVVPTYQTTAIFACIAGGPWSRHTRCTSLQQVARYPANCEAMMSMVRRAAVVLAGLLAAPSTALSAQDVSTLPVPRFEVSAGYAFLSDQRAFTHSGSTAFPKGWYASGAFNSTESFGFVGEVSGSHRSNLEFSAYAGGGAHSTISTDVRYYTALAGARFLHKIRRAVPFFQVLAGVGRLHTEETGWPAERGGTRVYGETRFAIQPGVGATVSLTENVGVRFAADFRSMIYFADGEENNYDNALRVIGGFTLQWGER